MSNNPFKPPDSDMKNRPSGPPGEPPVQGSPLKAVLTGLVVDLGGSTVISIVLSLLYHAQLARSGMSEDQITDAMNHIPPQSMFQIWGILLGALCSVAGGFVCARIVRRDEVRVGAVMAALSGFVSLLLGGATSDDMTLLLTLCTVACVMLGVKYGREANRRDAAPVTTPRDTPQP
jgi:hypothetical protein